MTVSVTTKSRTISNGTANDGSVVEAIQTELYNNDTTLASYINSNMPLLGSGNTFSQAQTLSAGAILAGTPSTNGQVGYASNQFKGYRNGSLLNFLMTGDAALPVSAVTARSSNTIWGTADKGTLFVCTSTFTQTVTASATLGSGWYCYVRNNGTGTITIDPNSTETIDGLPVIYLAPGSSCFIGCDSSNLFTIGRNKPAYIHLREEQTSGTNGGTFTSGAWRTRVLNTTVVDETGAVTLSSNQFTLPAGAYRIMAQAPAFEVAGNKLRLQNITDSSTTLFGTSANMNVTVSGDVLANLFGTFTITASKTFELQHYASTTAATYGLGFASGVGINEVYAEVWLEKLI